MVRRKERLGDGQHKASLQLDFSCIAAIGGQKDVWHHFLPGALQSI